MDIEEQYDKLLRYCYMKLRDKTLAEDITQETFIRFLENKNYRSTGKDMAYLYTIARNLCIDHFRKRRDDWMEDMPALPEAPDESCPLDERISIECALDKLEETERELVVLRFMAGLSAADIGKAVGLSRFAVHRRITSALDKLRKELGDDE